MWGFERKLSEWETFLFLDNIKFFLVDSSSKKYYLKI